MFKHTIIIFLILNNVNFKLFKLIYTIIILFNVFKKNISCGQQCWTSERIRKSLAASSAGHPTSWDKPIESFSYPPKKLPWPAPLATRSQGAKQSKKTSTYNMNGAGQQCWPSDRKGLIIVIFTISVLPRGSLCSMNLRRQ